MRVPSWQGTGLFVVLVLIGSSYLGSLAYLSIHSINYLDAGKMKRAQGMAVHTRLALPATLEFGNRSPSANYLVEGWQAPESWGVWGREAHAAILLPPIADASLRELCVAATFGTLPPRKSWPMRIVISGKTSSPAGIYQHGGPFTIRVMTPVQPNEPIRIDFFGPAPVAPASLDRHARDFRNLSFSLFQIAMTKHCN